MAGVANGAAALEGAAGGSAPPLAPLASPPVAAVPSSSACSEACSSLLPASRSEAGGGRWRWDGCGESGGDLGAQLSAGRRSTHKPCPLTHASALPWRLRMRRLHWCSHHWSSLQAEGLGCEKARGKAAGANTRTALAHPARRQLRHCRSISVLNRLPPHLRRPQVCWSLLGTVWAGQRLGRAGERPRCVVPTSLLLDGAAGLREAR